MQKTGLYITDENTYGEIYFMCELFVSGVVGNIPFVLLILLIVKNHNTSGVPRKEILIFNSCLMIFMLINMIFSKVLNTGKGETIRILGLPSQYLFLILDFVRMLLNFIEIWLSRKIGKRRGSISDEVVEIRDSTLLQLKL